MSDGLRKEWHQERETMKARIAELTALLSQAREDALEEAAKVAEGSVTYVVGEKRDLCDKIAAAIRSLSGKGRT